MKTGNRLISFFLAIVFVVSVFTSLSPMEVSAANNKPTAVTEKVSNISNNSITICGKITANGGAVITEYGFCYGLEGGSKTEYKVFKGSLDKEKIVSFTISNLQPGDSIWYEFYAKNSVGESKGQMMFAGIPEEKFDVSEYELEFDADGGKDTLWVYSSNSWSISDNQSWISVSPTSGTGDKKITVTCNKNTTAKDRDEGIITVTNKSTNEKLTISVYQEAAELKTEFDFSDFEISKNVVLGEDLTWKGYVYIENDIFDTVTISLKKVSDGNYIYYRKTGVSSTKFDTEKILNGGITTGQKAPKGHQQDSDGGWYEYNNFAIDEAGEYLLYITASGKNTGEYEKKEYKFTVTEPEEKEKPEVELNVNPTTITLGESFTYSGTAYGNDYDLNIVTVGISYFTSESNYEQEKGESVYLRNTGLSKEVFSVSGTIETGFGKSIKGTDNISLKEVILPMDRAGIYTVTLHGYSEEYGTDVKVHEKIYVKDVSSKTVGDIDGNGSVTNKDRFILNRYLAGMAGYTTINKTAADINGDGKVDNADAEYLTRHLAGWVGYEKLPDINPGECSHTPYTDIYSGTTKYVNNTIKTGTTHTYYHIWNRTCNKCGHVTKVQGDSKTEAHSYDSNGACVCGAINTAGYTKWQGINATGKKISVYDTPYSTDGSYGQLFVDEKVTVLGQKAGRYLIEYTVSSTGEPKQGYVNSNTIKSNSKYRIEFNFEKITLPVSGRQVLLIPKDGYAAYTLYDGNTKISVDTTKLKINFEDPAACNYGATTITGKVGGFGTLSVNYTVNGTKYYLQCPDYYIVADSNAVYTSDPDNVFSKTEKEYISMALDMYFSQHMIKVPYELYWSAGENFAYCISQLDNILKSLIKGRSPTQDDYAVILASFIDQYVKIENTADEDTIDEADDKAIDSLFKLLDNLKLVTDSVKTTKTLGDLIDKTINLYRLKDIDVNSLKELFSNVYAILSNREFQEIVKNSPELAKKLLHNEISINYLAEKIKYMIGSTKLWNEIPKAMKTLDTVGDALEIGQFAISFCVTTFGNWQRHRALLSMMLDSIDAIPESERPENYEMLRGAMVILLDKYDTEFWKKIDNGLKDAVADTIVFVYKKVLAQACPAAAGAMVVLDVAKFIIDRTDIGEEATSIRMRCFYLILNQSLMGEFKSLYEDGYTFSVSYSNAHDLVRMFLNMAIYTNQLAVDEDNEVNEYSEADKKVFKQNIEDIKKKFDGYLK